MACNKSLLHCKKSISLYRMRKVGLELGFKMAIDENVWFINSQGDRIPLTGHESNITESREPILTSAR